MNLDWTRHFRISSYPMVMASALGIGYAMGHLLSYLGVRETSLTHTIGALLFLVVAFTDRWSTFRVQTFNFAAAALDIDTGIGEMNPFVGNMGMKSILRANWRMWLIDLIALYFASHSLSFAITAFFVKAWATLNNIAVAIEIQDEIDAELDTEEDES